MPSPGVRSDHQFRKMSTVLFSCSLSKKYDIFHLKNLCKVFKGPKSISQYGILLSTSHQMIVMALLYRVPSCRIVYSDIKAKQVLSVYGSVERIWFDIGR